MKFCLWVTATMLRPIAGILIRHPFGWHGKNLLQPSSALVGDRVSLPAIQHRMFAKQEPDDRSPVTRASKFQRGMRVIVEVMKFGPLGASVDVVATSHDPKNVIQPSEDPLGQGLIDQQEIKYFRASRDGLDVVLGELLKAYVTHVREEDGKLSIGLRPFGGRGKATELGAMIMERLQAEGSIPVGDKSRPNDIEREFPGASKLAFKKAVAALFKDRKVQPGPFSVTPYSATQDDS